MGRALVLTPSVTSVPNSTASMGSALTFPSVTPSGPPPLAPSLPRGSNNNTRADNPSFNQGLFGAYKVSSIKSADLRKKIAQSLLEPLPRSRLNSTQPMCLAWHTKGQCNAVCPAHEDHVAYTEAEYAPLATWCREQGYKDV